MQNYQLKKLHLLFESHDFIQYTTNRVILVTENVTVKAFTDQIRLLINKDYPILRINHVKSQTRYMKFWENDK